MKRIFKALLVLVVVSFIIPQMALAAWWNPLSWKIFNIFKKPQTTITNQSIQKNVDPVINQDILNEELKKQEEEKIKQDRELGDIKKELQRTSMELQKLKEKGLISEPLDMTEKGIDFLVSKNIVSRRVQTSSDNG